MLSWRPDRFEPKKPFLQHRMALIRALRSWFEAQDFWEVETPALQVMPTADTHIHGIEAKLHDVALQPLESRYLHTSPEIAMKKLLVAGLPKIYQICRVFRNGEHTRLHRPEFTMLEWYRVGGDYHHLMADCQDMVRSAAKATGLTHFTVGDYACDPFAEWQKISVQQAFERYAGQAYDPAMSEYDFFALMADKIEPQLGHPAPTILYDYPASMAALARKKPSDPRWAERCELYICGVELANGFSELTDAAEQRARLEVDMAEKQRQYGYRYDIDEDFIAALQHGLPECTGMALGIDRLAMVMCGAEDISQVLWTD